MNVKEWCKKSVNELKDELLSLMREQFKLRMQVSSNQLRQTHLLKQSRRNIARIKTMISEKSGSQE